MQGKIVDENESGVLVECCMQGKIVDENESGVLVECCMQGKIEVLGEKPGSVPL
jgi:hypothetical protein